MVRFAVPYDVYLVFASIFKAGRNARCSFTYGDFHKAMQAIGFELNNSGDLVPAPAVGTQCFAYARIKGQVQKCTKVPKQIQDKWKRELGSLYGWNASTFEELL